jgi:hypothetical protein
MNIGILIAFLGIVSYALVVWFDVSGARHLAKLLNRRATCLEASRDVYKRTMQWCKVRERE